ncbi:MAG: GNAT family N-acetyltransferase [Sediminibacterium sp. Gen4]|jgi:hypothetical protein|uniref:GNAT family N-acetyltransferase n=1 Tax=unclassified Sediminibacterium TaxID=2635961 RepID=UPI0015BA168B|nr:MULTISPECIES: GNAT family N-acetyltransferase [unclassified Sediminibacterium]MBW0161197.1 GNAT family N-acetyltransferase [Sediminibacterium sp.]MBW0163723.1 GNAT family N-acetyltransferase [Sediminibacterium sp.]NWK66927.1 GNAT family N-acetyltransferase [Sediminibacterium sp. Gen4]
MLEIIKYTAAHKKQWDELVAASKNGTFLFLRDYMDYHADRFTDASYMLLRKGKMEALLPGNIKDKSYYSHQGLTYGGWVSSTKLAATEIVEAFQLLNSELATAGVDEVIYKPVPLIYHQVPAQEDLYALFLNKAEKIACHISSTIYQNNKPRFIESRKSGIRKAVREGVKISETTDFAAFWNILENNLGNKFNTKPVHSLEEIELLSGRFPSNIKLYLAHQNGEAVAGTVLYVMKNIIHVQYISASLVGKECGALDLLFDQLINQTFAAVPVFDFGQSTEQMGNYLNENLIFQKEGFGGRGIVYEAYRYSI